MHSSFARAVIKFMVAKISQSSSESSWVRFAAAVVATLLAAPALAQEGATKIDAADTAFMIATPRSS